MLRKWAQKGENFNIEDAGPKSWKKNNVEDESAKKLKNYVEDEGSKSYRKQNVEERNPKQTKTKNEQMLRMRAQKAKKHNVEGMGPES